MLTDTLKATTPFNCKATMTQGLVRITYSVFGVRMKCLLNAIEERNKARINRLCEVYQTDMRIAEVAVLSASEIDYVVDMLLYIQLLCTLEVFECAYDATNQLKSWHQDVCITRQNIVTMLKDSNQKGNGFYKQQKEMLGCIADLPNLVLLQIGTILENDYKLS